MFSLGDDKKLAIILGIVFFILFGFTLYVNIYDSFDYLADPLAGEGLGQLCSDAEDCGSFCDTSMAMCVKYCQANPEKTLCDTLIGGGR